MILQALTSYYDRLDADPDANIPKDGFSVQKVAFCVVLSPKGKLVQIEDSRQQVGKRLVPRLLTVPGKAKPSGSGLNPVFLWDNSQYMLGYKPDDPNPKRTAKAFEAFRDLHLQAKDKIDTPEYQAVCRFLADWSPDNAAEHDVLADIQSGFGVFRIQGQKKYIHDIPAIRRHALKRSGDSDGDGVVGQCLVTGRSGPLARLHEPKIKNVNGAQSSGAVLVSFNKDAFTSYGKDQSYNAPVGQESAFKYATALNHLLRSDSTQKVRIGDATAVFWTEGGGAVEEIFGQIFEGRGSDDPETLTRVESTLRAIASGRYVDDFGDPQMRYYILGLSPNASRLSVRFWYTGTLEEFCERLGRHFNDLAIIGPDFEPEFPSFWRILIQTARETKDISPILGGALARSVLTDSKYPEALYAGVLRRIRADRVINRTRAGILKAHLNRNVRFQPNSNIKEIPVALDTTRTEPSYRLGRLFAVLEKAQEDALGGNLNSTIKDRFFSSASATPAAVLPRLIRLSQHHLAKLTRGRRISLDKRIQEIVGELNAFPAHLNLQGQGLFAIGYYHQRQDLFTKKTTDNKEEE